MKVLSLFSGGLDSLLSTIWAKKNNFDVEAIYFSTPFIDNKKINYYAEANELNLNIVELKDDYLHIVENPKYGWGKNVNPCMDCHAFFIKKTGDMLEEKKASFIITGEVLGQRPMSQRKDGINIVDKLSGYKELTIRPLSGKLFLETTPEKLGWVDRNSMFDISGRGRKRQFELAKLYNIKEFSSPGGGCLLTESEYSKKIIDLIKFKQFNNNIIKYLRVGRHFRSLDGTKIIIGRNEEDNNILEEIPEKNGISFNIKNKNSPTGFIFSPFKENDIKVVSELILNYSKFDSGIVESLNTKISGKYNKINKNIIDQIKI